MIRKYIYFFSYCLILTFLFCFSGCKDDEIEEAPFFSISGEHLEQHFVADIGVVKVPVHTNLEPEEWNITSSADWCIGTKAYGAEYEGVAITVEHSEEPEVRTATVTVKSKTGDFTIKVNQLGYGPAILVKQSSVPVSYLGGEVVLEITSNVAYEYSIQETASWLTPAPVPKSLADSGIHLQAEKNEKYFSRTALVVFKAKDYEDVATTCEVKQATAPTDPGGIEIEDDIQLKVVSGIASEWQPGHEIEKSFNGIKDDENSHYHSDWFNTQLPVTLEYFFDGQEELDYIIYHPRNSNGNFGAFDVYVQSKGGNEEFAVSYDFGGKDGSSRIVLPQTTPEIEKVKFVVHSGASGFVSCLEMEFFRTNRETELAKQLLKVFTDITCVELREDVTEEDINALPGYFVLLALTLKDDRYDPWEREFRVRDYQPYSNVEQWAARLMTKKYSNLDNPVGIYVQRNDTIMVLVGPKGAGQLSLMSIQERNTGGHMEVPATGVMYGLAEGVNKVAISESGDLFLVYTGDPSGKPVRVHIPPGSGTVNGFFDVKEHRTDAKYAELISKATHKYFTVKGERMMFYFHRDKLMEYVPNTILPAINLWDNFVEWQHELMGISDVYPSQMNNHIMAISPEGGYMWASDYRIGFVHTYLNNILLKDNVMAEKDNAWGPAHEIGHIHQAAINWPGSFESSNNLFSNYTLYKLGKYCSRGTELSLPEVAENQAKKTLAYIRCVKNLPWCEFGDDSADENTELHMRMNWQLWIYYHLCGNKPDFWPTLFKLMRDNRLETYEPDMIPGEKQLLFARMASQAAGEDLTEFFERWGFFVPVDKSINQYGPWDYKVTQEMINTTKQAMSKYPKARPFYYIEDRRAGDQGLETTPPDVGIYTQFKGTAQQITKNIQYTSSGKAFRITNGDQAVAFELRKGNELLYFSTFFEFTVPDQVSLDGAVLYAVQADGKLVEIKKN